LAIQLKVELLPTDQAIAVTLLLLKK
jgi:hypothetical protein